MVKPSSSASSSLKTRKRPAASPSPVEETEEEDPVLALGAQLAAEDEELDEDDDEEYEIDTGSSNGDLEDFNDSEDEDEGEPIGLPRSPKKSAARIIDLEGLESSDEEFDEEDDGLDNSSGYNSSDIDALSSPPSPSTPSTSLPSSSLPANATLDELIAFHSHKPTDEDSLTQYQRESANGVRGTTYSAAKQGKGKLVKSKLVKGGWKREYEDIEAGYGSESSTEDVSIFLSLPVLSHLHPYLPVT